MHISALYIYVHNEHVYSIYLKTALHVDFTCYVWKWIKQKFNAIAMVPDNIPYISF